VTVTLVRPGVLVLGTTAVISVFETTVKLVAAVVPKSTAVAPVKLVPVMVIVDPPERRPEAGVMEVMVGGVERVDW
jgi:hypothetical protein